MGNTDYKKYFLSPCRRKSLSHRMNDFDVVVVAVIDAATLTCTMPDVQDQMPADMVLFILFVRYLFSYVFQNQICLFVSFVTVKTCHKSSF